jgi:phosphate-selective porin OprO/OprP
MFAPTRKTTGALALCGLAALLLSSGTARASDPEISKLIARIEKLESDNAELQKRLQSGEPFVVGANQSEAVTKQEVRKLVADALQDDAAKNKPAGDAVKKDPSKWYEVGTDLSMSATWKNGLFLTTPQKDFTMHIGGWMQLDNVWFDEGKLVAAPGSRPGAAQGVASGVAMGGIGDLEDGIYFRRIRPMIDGTFWETGEYTLILALENNQFSTAGLDEFWVGARDLPLIGTVRIGHVKTPMGLEADMTASSRAMTFMERSSYSEAVEENENFVTGIWLGNNYFDQRATWSFAAFRQDIGSSTGAQFGDGQYGLQGRLTSLPLWQNDGRCFLHLGLSGGWRNGTNNLAVSAFRTFQLRARPELRDDDPASSPSGGQALPNADSNRMIDTGSIVAQQQWLTGLEALWVFGPLSVQAEYGLNWIEDAIGFAPSGSTLNPALIAPTNYVFHGGYVQVAYTLTGESRSYDKRLGRLDTYYFGRQGPFTNAWFVRGEDGHLHWGLGAWEIAGRYSYTNLNDGSGLSRIEGGTMDGWTVGLNWYLSDNVKFMFDYVYNHRYALPSGAIPGSVQGFGIEMQFMF